MVVSLLQAIHKILLELTIKHKGERLIYNTDDGGVVVTTIHKNGLSSTQHYPFEIVRKERELYNSSTPLYLIGAGLFFLMTFVIVNEGVKTPEFPWLDALLASSIAFALIALHFLLKKKVYLLKTFQGSFIRFPVIKNPAEINVFVNHVIEKRNRYLKLKYGSPNEFKSYDSQYSNFNTLLREGVITEEEYKNNIKELSETFRQTAPGQITPGFSSN